MKNLTIIFFIALGVILTSMISMAAEEDNKIEWDGIYSDQTSLFMMPPEPMAEDDITLILRTYKNDITSCRIRYWNGEENFVEMTRVAPESSSLYDYWSGTLPSEDRKRTYRFEVFDGSDRGWYTSVGHMEEPVYDRDFIIIPGFITPSWMKDAIVYQIFPDRFYDGAAENNVEKDEYNYLGTGAYTHENWSDLPDNPTKCADFFGGDLQGIKEKIPYLKELGVTVIYLNPIFISPSNHKYDTQDYRNVDPHFGGNEALMQLVKELHDNNMKLILDGVFNHTGSKHLWFDKEGIYETTGAYESKDSPWYDFYTFREWPDNYYCWWGFETLPKIDYNSPNVRNEIYAGDNSIARMWIKDYDIDGWRLDVPNEVGISGRTDEHGIWKGFREAVKDAKKDAYITGEIWGNASQWLDGTQFDSVMNYYGHMEPLWMWLGGVDHNGNKAEIKVSEFDEWLTYSRSDYYFPCIQTGLNLLDSHDTPRFLTVLNGDIKKFKLGVIFQMTYTGAPMIYYGDEIGTEGGKDPDCRRTFDWNKDNWNNELVDLYKKLTDVRHNYSALRTGSFETFMIDDEKNIYSYARYDEDGKFVVLLNGGEENTVTLPLWRLDISENATVKELLSGSEYTVENGEIRVDINSEEGLVFLVEDK